MQDESRRTVKSVDRACEILDYLRDNRGATVSGVAGAVDLSVGSVHTHLATLKRQGLVVQKGDEYDLGPELLTMGEYVRNHDALYQASKESVDRLAEDSGECAHLIFEHRGQLYALYERFGSEAVGIEFHDRKREEGLRHLHCTAAGKAILAHLPDDHVTSIVDETGLPAQTQNTITDVDKLKRELESVREEKAAFADEEQLQGIRAVGAPIMDRDRSVAGAIAVSGPASRLNGDRFRSELPAAVSQAANVCEVNLQTTDLEDGI